jgi:membrane protease YdiL (CAAX protease family)
VEIADPQAVASRPAYLVLLALLVGHFVLGGAIQALDLPFGLAFSEVFVLALPVLLLTRAQNFRPAEFLGLVPPPAALVLASVVVGAITFFFAGGINSLNNLIVGEEIAKKFDPSALFEIADPWRRALLVVGVSVLAPLGEELLFRGYLLRVLRARHGTRAALVITAAIFAAIHVNPASVLALFALGLVFGLLRVISGSLWPSLVAHALQNGTSSAIVLLGLAKSSPDELSPGTAVLMLAVSTPLLALALRAVRNASPPEPPPRKVDPALGNELQVQPVRAAGLAWLGGAVLALAVFAVSGGPALALRARQLVRPAPSPVDVPDVDHR